MDLTVIFRQIFKYTTSSTDTAAFIIGGFILNLAADAFLSSSIVAEFSQLPSETFGSWKHRGNTLRGRSSAQAIQLNDQTFVVGGYGEQGR